MGGWAIHHQEPAHSTLRFQLAASALLLLFLPEVPTPARYFPVALSSAGDTVILDSWAIHHQEPATNTLRFQLAASALLLLFLPEVPTPARYFPVALSGAGD